VKLTVTQAQHVLRRLKLVAMDTVAQIEGQLKESMVPPKVTTAELKKYLTKLAYDTPKELVSMILKKTPWPLEQQRYVEREQGFEMFHKAMASLRENVDRELLGIESDLLFLDDWAEGYPEYLETELVETIVGWVSPDDES
jgi:nicotinamide riboside kinase